MDFVDQLPSRTSMSREAIDARLEQERDIWSSMKTRIYLDSYYLWVFVAIP